MIYYYVALFIGEGNGTPLQYFCLENPMDGGAGGLQSTVSLESDTTKAMQQQHTIWMPDHNDLKPNLSHAFHIYNHDITAISFLLIDFCDR